MFEGISRKGESEADEDGPISQWKVFLCCLSQRLDLRCSKQNGKDIVMQDFMLVLTHPDGRGIASTRKIADLDETDFAA